MRGARGALSSGRGARLALLFHVLGNVFGRWLSTVDVQDVTNGRGAQYLRSRVLVFGEVQNGVRPVFCIVLVVQTPPC